MPVDQRRAHTHTHRWSKSVKIIIEFIASNVYLLSPLIFIRSICPSHTMRRGIECYHMFYRFCSFFFVVMTSPTMHHSVCERSARSLDNRWDLNGVHAHRRAGSRSGSLVRSLKWTRFSDYHFFFLIYDFLLRTWSLLIQFHSRSQLNKSCVTHARVCVCVKLSRDRKRERERNENHDEDRRLVAELWWTTKVLIFMLISTIGHTADRHKTLQLNIRALCEPSHALGYAHSC